MGRPLLSIATNGLSSCIGLLIAVSIAHSYGLVGLGEYALTFALYSVALGVAGAVGAISVLSLLPDDDMLRIFSQRVSAVGITCSVPVFITGLVLDFSYFVALGVALHGMLLHDYSKKVKTSIRRGAPSMVIELCILMLVAVVALWGTNMGLPGEAVFWAWCAATMVSGYSQSLSGRLQLRPRWTTGFDSPRSAAVFGGENLAGAGAGHLLVASLSALHGLPLVGALRGAGTVLGPANLITTSAQSLIIPLLARARKNSTRGELRNVLWVSSAVTAGVGVMAFPLLAMPDELGVVVLGSVWSEAQSVLLALCVECVATAASVVAISGHRVYGRARVLMGTSVALIPVRIICSLGGAFLAGAQGAALGMALSACIGAALYWFSYLRLINSRVRLPGNLGDLGGQI